MVSEWYINAAEADCDFASQRRPCPHWWVGLPHLLNGSDFHRHRSQDMPPRQTNPAIRDNSTNRTGACQLKTSSKHSDFQLEQMDSPRTRSQCIRHRRTPPLLFPHKPPEEIQDQLHQPNGKQKRKKKEENANCKNKLLLLQPPHHVRQLG